VADLHTRGYQRLRIIPYVYDLGTWRCMIAPAHWVSGTHGAKLDSGIFEERIARYGSASGREYWGWEDTHHCSPSRLAEVFLERFQELATLGYGQDWSYVGWYQHMLHVTHPDALPIAFGAYEEADSFMTTLGRPLQFALPPVGLATPR
jgi:hypothetical protein